MKFVGLRLGEKGGLNESVEILALVERRRLWTILILGVIVFFIMGAYCWLVTHKSESKRPRFALTVGTNGTPRLFGIPLPPGPTFFIAEKVNIPVRIEADMDSQLSVAIRNVLTLRTNGVTNIHLYIRGPARK